MKINIDEYTSGKKGLILPKRDYFKWDEYRDLGLIVEGGITIINGGRNIGKTTGSLIEWLNLSDENNMLVFVRNTIKEIEEFRKTFNSTYSHSYFMSSTTIFRLKKEVIENKKTGDIEEIYKKESAIGIVHGLSGNDGLRSAIIPNIKYIFCDEYNQVGNSLNTELFITFWTSMLRAKKDVYTLIIGNRDDIAADLLVQLKIRVLVDNNFKGDYIQRIFTNPNSQYYNKGWFIDLDDSRYGVNDDSPIWAELGRQTRIMGAYYDRGYKSYENLDCRMLDFEILDKINWKFAFIGDDKLSFIVGELEGLIVVHQDWENRYLPNIKMKLADDLNYLTTKKTQRLRDNIPYCFKTLTKAIKEDNIHYTNVPTKEATLWFLAWLQNFIDDETMFKI